MRKLAKIIPVEHDSGIAHVAFFEGEARPFQISVRPNLQDSNWDAPSRLVRLKTIEAVVARLNKANKDNELRSKITA
jgi:hypothetical protein